MIRKIIAPALVLLSVTLHAAPPVPLVNLVDDKTLLAVSLTDTPALLRGWDAGPLAATWTDPQVVKFLAPLRTEMKIDQWDDEAKAATGLTVRELLGLAQGEALLALSAFELTTFDPSSPPPLLIALEIGSHADKVSTLMADAAKKHSRPVETEDFAGVKVVLQPVADADKTDIVAWAVVDGVWLLGPKKETVFAAIDALKQGGHVSALGKSDGYLRTRARGGDAQSLFYLNVPAIYPLLKQGVAVAKAQAAGQPNMLGLDYEMAFDALGLDAIGEIYLAMHTGADETRLDTGLFYSGDRGLMKVLAYVPGVAPRPEWVPAKWPSVSAARFSVPQAYAGLKDLLEGISPMFSGMAQGQIRALNKKLGVDLERDLIGSLGDELVSAYAVPPGFADGSVPAWNEMDQVFALSLVNEAAFAKAVDALKLLAGPAAEQMFIKRDYLGSTIHTLNLPPAPEGAPKARGFSYAIAGRTLLLSIGSAAPVENALQGMNSKRDSFWDRADVKAVLADAPGGASIVQVQDLGVMMNAFVEAAVQFQKQQDAAPADEDTEKKTYVDVSARPDAGTLSRYWGLSAGHGERTSEGLFSTARIPHVRK